MYVLRKRINTTEFIISISTIPSRVDGLQKIVNNFMNQTIKPKYIVINAPLEYVRFKDIPLNIPDEIKNHPNVIINRIPTDYGPASKVLGLCHLDDQIHYDYLLITDDDCIKHKYWCETIVTELVKSTKYNNIGSVVSLVHENTWWNQKDNFLYGFTGFGFTRELFISTSNRMRHSFLKHIKPCFFVDDNFFTHFFTHMNIKIKTVRYKDEINLEIDNKDGLYDIKGNNDRDKSINICNAAFLSGA